MYISFDGSLKNHYVFAAAKVPGRALSSSVPAICIQWQEPTCFINQCARLSTKRTVPG